MSTYTCTELENEAYKLSCLPIFILGLGKRLAKIYMLTIHQKCYEKNDESDRKVWREKR